jgi:hypothetical protein
MNVSKGAITAPDPIRFNSTGELNRIERCDHSYDPIRPRLNPTGMSSSEIFLDFQSILIDSLEWSQRPIRPIRCDYSHDPTQLDPTGESRSVESDRIGSGAVIAPFVCLTLPDH